MQETTVGMTILTHGSLELGGIIFLQVVVGGKPDSQNSPIATSCKTMILPMSWQRGKVVELDNKQNKQFDPGGRWGDAPHAKQRLYRYLLQGGLGLDACLFVCRFSYFSLCLQVKSTTENANAHINLEKGTNVICEPD